jgi:hypothetical protein
MREEITNQPVSPEKLQANRENVKKSTGPRTAEGKRNSSRNALKHGLFVKDLVIRSGKGKENPREFQQLFENLRKDLQPEGQLEELQVFKIAVAHWQLRRALRAEAGEIVNGFVKEEQLELGAVASHRNIPEGEAATRILRYQMGAFARRGRRSICSKDCSNADTNESRFRLKLTKNENAADRSQVYFGSKYLGLRTNPNLHWLVTKMADVYPRNNIFREAYRKLLRQPNSKDRRGRNNAQKIAAVFISKGMTGDRKPIKHLREALRGVLFISALELKQTPPTLLSVAYEQLLAESVPGDKRGRTFCELIAAVVVARALDGDQRAKRELRDTLSPPRVPFVLESSVRQIV